MSIQTQEIKGFPETCNIEIKEENSSSKGKIKEIANRNLTPKNEREITEKEIFDLKRKIYIKDPNKFYFSSFIGLGLIFLASLINYICSFCY